MPIPFEKLEGWLSRLMFSKELNMAALNGSKTESNLKNAFSGESQANRRYLYFAQKADIEGYNDVAAVFRSTAEGETGHAHGHLEFLEAVGDPATGPPIGSKRSPRLSARMPAAFRKPSTNCGNNGPHD